MQENANKPLKKGGMASMRFQNRVFLTAMLIIPIVHWLIFWLYMNLQSILMAFQLPTGDWSLLNFKSLWIELTSPTSNIVLAVKNTFMWFGLQTFIIFPFTIALNYFFFKKIPGYKAFRILLYIPTLLSSVAIAEMVKALVMPDTGPLWVILNAAGMDVPQFFSDSQYANKAMIIYTLWLGWGSNMLLLGGTFARVPQEVLEAAKLDGCGPFRELVQLILPMISSTLVTMVILKLSGLFTSSGPIILFTRGTAAVTTKTLTLSYWIWESVLGGSSNYNTVAATGLAFTAIAVPLILTIRWLLEKIPVVEY